MLSGLDHILNWGGGEGVTKKLGWSFLNPWKGMVGMNMIII